MISGNVVTMVLNRMMFYGPPAREETELNSDE